MKTPGRRALIDQLVEALRQESASGPVPASAMSHRMPPYRWESRDGAPKETPRSTQWLYNELRAAEAQGRCRRVPDPLRANGVLWEWTGDAAEVDNLEAMFDGVEMADLRRVFESEPDVPAPVARTATGSLDSVSTVEEMLAERGYTVAWADRMEWQCLHLPAERVVVLNSSCADDLLRESVTRLLDSEALG